jgi:hypothetical protein
LPGVEHWWRQVADLVLSVRESVDCPVIASSAFDWNTQALPRIEGLYAGSIGKAAGLRIGDVAWLVDHFPTDRLQGKLRAAPPVRRHFCRLVDVDSVSDVCVIQPASNNRSET